MVKRLMLFFFSSSKAAEVVTKEATSSAAATSASRRHRRHGAGVNRQDSATKGSETKVSAATCSVLKGRAGKETTDLGIIAMAGLARGRIAAVPGKIRETSALGAGGVATLATTGAGVADRD